MLKAKNNKLQEEDKNIKKQETQTGEVVQKASKPNIEPDKNNNEEKKPSRRGRPPKNVKRAERVTNPEVKKESTSTGIKSSVKFEIHDNGANKEPKIVNNTLPKASNNTNIKEAKVSEKKFVKPALTQAVKAPMVKSYERKPQDIRPFRDPRNNVNNKNGGKYYKAHDKQQQDARYYLFVKSIKDMSMDEFRSLTFAELNHIARRLGIIGSSLMRKEDLLKKIIDVREHPDREEEVSGVLEKLPDGFGFLRSHRYNYISGPDDIYVSPSQIRRFGLKTGDTVTGTIRKPKDGEKYFALLKINKINFKEPIPSGDRLNFDRLVPYHPEKKFNLEYDPHKISTRLIDIFSPIGKGQRGLIVAPPKVGKTVLLKDIAQALLAENPEIYLIVLLIDERPEEVTDMRMSIKNTNSEVVSSTFDESANRHVQVAEIVLEKAKRLVEAGTDVVILLDSITRLARAYNTISPASGKVLSGGIDANALQRPKRFFGAARYTKDAGSLTIIATTLVDTGSRMDEVIYEEFKGTGNMEMHMTRKLSNRRIYPAFDLLSSGTRRDDLLLPEDTLKKVWVLQKFISTLNVIEGMEFLIDKMKKHKTNEDFLDSINK